MAIDRAAVLRTAEKLLGQGKLELAIAEYARVVEEQPQDWATANTLGDLYLRAKFPEKAIEQFVKIADHLFKEGFHPRAAAVYKKILKIRPDDEHALIQTGDIAAKQGVLVDARSAWKMVAAHRLARGDRQGAAEMRVKLGALDPADLEARRDSARARVECGDVGGALRELQALADELGEKGRHADAVDVLEEAARVSPDDQKIQGQLFAIQMTRGDLAVARRYARTPEQLRTIGQAYVAAGRMDEAAEFLKGEAAASNPRLVLKVAEAKFKDGAFDAGVTLLRELLTQDPQSATEIARLGLDLARSSPETGFRISELITAGAIREGDWALAAAGLQEFARQNPNYVPALMRLVEVCVDGGLETALYGAQALLADAYLATGAAAEARVIAEDLVSREPDEHAHVARLHRALALLGPEKAKPPAVAPPTVAPPIVEPRREPPSVDRPVARVEVHEERSTGPAAVPEPKQDRPPQPEPAAPPVSLKPAESEAAPLADEVMRPGLDLDDFAHLELSESLDLESLLTEVSEPSEMDVDSVEIDLSILLEDFSHDGPAHAEPPDPRPVVDEPGDLEDVFERLRADGPSGQGHSSAEQEYERGIALRDAGRFEESVQALQAASRAPRQRFRAAASLGRIYKDHGTLRQAIEWFERAAEAPAPTTEESHALCYELAEALEAAGETARALSVCLELQADAGEYRDVSKRINRLSRTQARG